MELKWKAIGGSAIGVAIITLIVVLNYPVTTNTYYCADEPQKLMECNYGISGGAKTRCYLNEAKSKWDYCSTGWIKALDYIEKEIVYRDTLLDFENVDILSNKKDYNLALGNGFGKHPVITEDARINGTTQGTFEITDLTGKDRNIDIVLRIQNVSNEKVIIDKIWNWSSNIPHYEEVITYGNITCELCDENITWGINGSYQNLTHYGPGWKLINKEINSLREKDYNKSLVESIGEKNRAFYGGYSIYNILLKANETNKYKFSVKGEAIKRTEFLILVYSENQLVGILDPYFIEISDAIHLDSNRDLINNIYNEVKALDNIWSEPVYTNEFVRVNFSLKLDNTRDITVYARNNDSYDAYLEFYAYNSTIAFAQSSLINEEGYYKTLLTNLTGLYQEFDIKIVSNQNTFLEFNHIIDPSVPTHTTPILNSTDEANPTTANLTVYNQSTSDLDNNAVTNIIDWRLNGSSFAVLNMPFDTNQTGSTGSVIRDYSLNVNNGTLNGSITWNASGKRGGAYKFDGVNDHIDVSYSSTLPTSGDLTFVAWVNPANAGAGAIVAQGDGTDGQAAYQIRLGAVDNQYFALGNGSSAVYVVFSALSNNQWTHLAATVQGTAISVYKDGALAGTATFSGTRQSPTTSLHLGRRSDGFFFNGTIDDVRIYNRALTLKEIQMLYNNKTDMIDSGTTGSAGEKWSACITPNDGTGDGSTLCSSNLTIGTDSTPPKFYDAINATSIANGNNITMNISIEDGIRLVNYTFSWNDTGSWVNDTPFQIGGSITNWDANTSKQITASLNTVVSWRYYACDNSSNCAASGLYNFTVVAISDTSAPSFSGSINNTLFKRYFNASMNLTIDDDTDISNYTFSWNESGSFVNDTSVQLAGTQTTWFMNISKNITNALYNQIVQWRVYSCDSSNNCNTSATENMTIANTLPVSINQSYIIQSTYSNTLRSFFNSSWNDVDQDNATLTVKLESNYTGTPSNYTANNITKGVYNYSAILPAGTHTRRWCATDSASAVNCTDLETFTINKTSPNVELYLNSSRANISIAQTHFVNLTANMSGIGNLLLYNASILIGNSTLFPYGNKTQFNDVGTFNITAESIANQNWSYNSETWWVIVISENVKPVITSKTLVIGIDWITASCTATDNIAVINYTISINGTGERSGNLSSCSYTFVNLNTNLSYNLTFFAQDLAGNVGSGSLINITKIEAIREWIPIGDIVLKWVYEIKEAWKLSIKKIFIISDDELTQTKIWQNRTDLTFENNNSGNYIFDNNISSANLQVKGCIKYNCSQGGGCITLGLCL